MLQIKQLTFKYADDTILQDLSIDFENEQVHSIVGLNGSGKTTFFNILAGYLEPDAGQILQDGKRLAKNSIAYIDAESFFYPKLTAAEFLSVFPQTNPGYKEDELMHVFSLPANEFIETFSTGMKKKLLIISQLKQDKQVYIFDEPFNGLDLESNRSLQIIIKLLAQKQKTIFIASHIIEPLFGLCFKIHHLKNKHIVSSFTREDFHKLDDQVFGELTDQLVQTINHSI